MDKGIDIDDEINSDIQKNDSSFTLTKKQDASDGSRNSRRRRVRSSTKNRVRDNDMFKKVSPIDEINAHLNYSAELTDIKMHQDEEKEPNRESSEIREFKLEKAAIIDEDVNSQDAQSVDDKDTLGTIEKHQTQNALKDQKHEKS